MDTTGAVVVTGRDGPVRAVRSFDDLAEAVAVAVGRPTASSEDTARRIDRPADAAPATTREAIDACSFGLAGASPLVRAGVLVIEDNDVNRDIMVRQLQALGIDASEAGDGLQGYACWQRTRPALVLLDCHMPGMDGYTLARNIRRAEADGARRTTIVAISANATHDDIRACHAAGMDDYLAKPITRHKFAALLQKWADTTDADAEPTRG